MIVLEINRTDTNLFIINSNEIENTIHLAKNPRRGGIPANLPSTNIGIHLFCDLRISVIDRTFFVLNIISKNRTEIQYINVNIRNIIVLTRIAVIIHLRLNTEE